MKKIIGILYITAIFVVSCVENPYVTEDVYLETDNPTSSWVNGLKREIALTLNQVVVNTELVSDNYFNNYSSYSKVFDIPEIVYTDQDVNSIQAEIAALREMADYGLETVIPSDDDATSEEHSFMLFCKAYSMILAGENFVGLPQETLGKVVAWDETLESSIDYLDQAIDLTTDTDLINAYNLLKARVYRSLGEIARAKEYAAKLIGNTDLLLQVEYDGENDITNSFQYAIFTSSYNMFVPLPRLDFLDPKYYDEGTAETDQKPISMVKAEEAYLIMAEVYIAEGNLSSARSVLADLIQDVVSNRATAILDDSNDDRKGSNRTDYPTEAVKVRFSSSDSLRNGYVLDRQAGDIVVHTLSGTLVTTEEINSASTEDELLYLVYRLRQEIFIGEGRRMNDLGIRFPVSQTEQLSNPNVTDDDIEAVIPSFIPLDYGMDDFTVDETTGDVTMVYDMNAVLIANKTSAYVLPFYE